MKIGVIDIGTNTVLLLIARFDAHGMLKTVRDEQRVIRVGEGVDATKKINTQAIERLNACLNDLKSTARDSDEVDRLAVFGTSAFRSAENCAEVLQAVKEDASI
ncbi:MAG TPA: Ppx/GppA family phosphatase, partial [Candidatus Kapabacteria bacterium]|nr:Ppx/GppA family phosphatase [Candidatus Kapabacteria bacterium]